MSASLPEAVDAWRMVASGRILEGSLPLTALPRLAASLADASGACRFRIEFGRDDVGFAFAQVDAEAELPLTCQRTLEVFSEPVRVSQRIGLVRNEREEAGLPADAEAVLVPEDGHLVPAELIEDELILALPVVPVKPGSEAVEASWASADAPDEDERPNPFAALSALKQGSTKT